MKKSIARIICFILALTIVLWKVNGIFKFKFADSFMALPDFYRLDNDTVDVVIIGSSHASVNFNAGTLWDEHGITSYILGASVQPMWNSYYYLKEALKTQTPELIILEGYGVTFDFEYSDDSRIMKNTYGMKWSLDKIEAIKESAPDERESEFLLDYAQYHTRYSTLSQGDFFPESDYLDAFGEWHFGDAMGQYLFDTSKTIEIPDMSHVKEKIDLQEKSEKYYRKTIELAQENGIPIAVIVAPYILSEYEQGKYLKAQEIAEEYGVKFLNTNLLLEDIGFDFSTDYHDSVHMTILGSQRFSTYIGQYLKDNFEISDRRGNARYSAWEKCAEYTKSFLHDGSLRNSYDLNDISERLSNVNYWVYISLDGYASIHDEVIANFLRSQGINVDSSSVIWIKRNNELVYESGYNNQELYTRTTWHDICFKQIADDKGNYSNKIIIDNQQYQKVSNGLNVVVYNSLTDRVVDSFGINVDNNYAIIR